MNILALGGRMQAGKTTIAKYLRDRYQFHHLSLAAPLKRDLVAMGFPKKLVYVEKPDAIRALMQAYGQAWRYVNADHWLDKLFRQIAELRDRYQTPSLFEDCGIPGRKLGPFIVIDDLRFPNEVDALKDLGAYTVRVTRAGGLERDHIVGVKADASELALTSYQFDYAVTAPSGEIRVLHAFADDLLRQLGWVQ